MYLTISNKSRDYPERENVQSGSYSKASGNKKKTGLSGGRHKGSVTLHIEFLR